MIYLFKLLLFINDFIYAAGFDGAGRDLVIDFFLKILFLPTVSAEVFFDGL